MPHSPTPRPNTQHPVPTAAQQTQPCEHPPVIPTHVFSWTGDALVLIAGCLGECGDGEGGCAVVDYSGGCRSPLFLLMASGIAMDDVLDCVWGLELGTWWWLMQRN